MLLPLLAFMVILAFAPATGAHPPSDDPSPNDATVTGSGSTGETPGPEIPDPMEGVQSDEESLAQDLALVAQSRGWTVEEAAADHRAAEIVGDIAAEVYAVRPNIFVGSVLSSEPGGSPALYIKGPADDLVLELVDKAEIDIRVVDNQPFSFNELEDRKIRVHRALEEQGFRYVATGFSVTGGGQIKASVTTQEQLPSDEATILSNLPESLRDSVALTVRDSRSQWTSAPSAGCGCETTG